MGFLLVLFAGMLSVSSGCNKPALPAPEVDAAFVADLKKRTFTYFWEVVDSTTWQTDDRYPTKNFVSIAATGFALPAYIIGAENGFVTREQAAGRTLNVLDWMWKAKMGPQKSDVSGYNGFYYHFLNYRSGTRFKDVELSTIDTGLLMAGVLTAQSYFDGDSETEQNIRALSDSLYLRVQWSWAMDGRPVMSMGWKPESGFLKSSWTGYNEAMILLLLGLGSPTYPLEKEVWPAWTSTYNRSTFEGYDLVNFGPLFGHQYSQMFVDFRGIKDSYMQKMGIDYFENSRRATLSNRAYALRNPMGFTGYSGSIWGLTACDGPGGAPVTVNGRKIELKTYNARGVAADYHEDDGTIAPTAAGGSIPFAPEVCLPALENMYRTLGDKVYRQYGFIDAFNLSVSKDGWFDHDYIGIDQGPILIQLENHQTGLIWDILKKNKYIRSGMVRAGFSGGWLDQPEGKG